MSGWLVGRLRIPLVVTGVVGVVCAGAGGVAAGAGDTGDAAGAQLVNQQVAAVQDQSSSSHAGHSHQTSRQGLLLSRAVPGHTTDTLPLLPEVR